MGEFRCEVPEGIASGGLGDLDALACAIQIVVLSHNFTDRKKVVISIAIVFILLKSLAVTALYLRCKINTWQRRPLNIITFSPTSFKDNCVAAPINCYFCNATTIETSA